MNDKLFEVDIVVKWTEDAKECRECEHSERHQCNSKVFWYCGIRKSNRTANGQLKIKAHQESCMSFKPKK